MILDMRTPTGELMQRAELKKARARLTGSARSPSVNPQVTFSTSVNSCTDTRDTISVSY